MVWLVENIEVKEVSFTLDEQRLVGTLRIPDVGRPVPAVVVMGPLAGVRDQVAGHYAHAMAQRGFVSLAFDHRHFGDSGGEPRQLEFPARKAEDFRTAVRYVKSQVEVAPLRIGGIGICDGAGYLAYAAAKEHRIKAWASVAGHFHDVDALRARLGPQYDAEINRAMAARERYEETGICETIAVVGQGDVALPVPGVDAYYGTARSASQTFVNEMAVQSREHILRWDAQHLASSIELPTLLVHADRARDPEGARSFYGRLAGPKQDLWLPAQEHVEFYDHPDRIGEACNAIAKFFRANM